VRDGENGTKLAFTFAAVVATALLAIAVTAWLVRRAPDPPHGEGSRPTGHRPHAR
jgi:hypothetical protein